MLRQTFLDAVGHWADSMTYDAWRRARRHFRYNALL
jgi:hypothetical protein